MSLVYGIGVVFSVSVIPILLVDLYRVMAGKLSDDELVMITESEELAEVEELTHGLEDQRAGHPGSRASADAT